VNPGVGNGTFPMGQGLVLFLQAGKLFSFEAVVLDVLHPRLDFPLVSRHVRLGRQDHRAVVPAEGLHLGGEFWIEPVGMSDGRLEIVDHQRLGDAAEVRESILQAAKEVFSRLGEGRLAVRLAAVTEHDAKDVRLAALPIRRDDRRTGPKVHLGFLAGATLHPAERLS